MARKKHIDKDGGYHDKQPDERFTLPRSRQTTDVANDMYDD